MSGSKNNTMVTSTKHNSKPNVVPGRSPTLGLIGSGRNVLWNFLPTFSVAYMLIVVTILLVLLALAIIYKHVAKPSWIPSSQQLSEKFRLYMARSVVGDFTRRIFDWDIWSRSRQDTAMVSNKDEKNRRLSLDMSSSSSTSLSPSVLPTHNASPRLYKKTSNSRLTSQRRSSSRQKTQSQNIQASSLLSIEGNPSSTPSSSDSHSEQSSTFTEQDEIKTSITIHVAETLNSRTDPPSVDTCQGRVDKIGNNNDQSSSEVEHTNGKLKTVQHFIQDENNSWTESQQTQTVISNRYDKSRHLNADLTFSESSIPSTNNGSSKFQKKSSLKGHRKQNARNKEQTTVLATQESDGEVDSIISDDHSDSLIQQIDSTVPMAQKNMQYSTQEETFVKTEHKKRRRRTRSKNNQQKSQQSQQAQNSDQRSLKQEQLQKQDISQQSASDLPKSRNIGGKIKSKQYYFIHNALHDQNTYSKRHSDEILKSHQAIEKSKVANYDIWDRHLHQHHAESHQSSRSDQAVYFLQANKRTSQIANLNGTTIPEKATLPEPNRKAAVLPRTDIPWKPSVASSTHTSASSHNFNQTISNASISRFATYADATVPHNRPSTLPRSNTSGLSNGSNITTPIPAASMNNQWYSPFGSGLSIQLTPPASPQNTHRNLSSINSNISLNSALPSKQSQDRNRNVIAPPPSLSAPNNGSSLSMFTSPSFPTLPNSLSNQNQDNVITNSSFRESLFGRKHPVQDQEKGELSDEEDESKSWNKIMRISELNSQKTLKQNDDALPANKGEFDERVKNENVWHRERGSQQQFSLFDKRLSFMYPPNS